MVQPGAAGATAGRVGSFVATGTVVTVSASEDLAAAVVRIAVSSKERARIAVVTLDRDGRPVDRQEVSTGPVPFWDVAIDPGVPFATIRWAPRRQVPRATSQPLIRRPPSLLDSVECITGRRP